MGPHAKILMKQLEKFQRLQHAFLIMIIKQYKGDEMIGKINAESLYFTGTSDISIRNRCSEGRHPKQKGIKEMEEGCDGTLEAHSIYSPCSFSNSCISSLLPSLALNQAPMSTAMNLTLV